MTELRADTPNERGFRTLIPVDELAAGTAAAEPVVGEPVVALVHLSDLHLCDAESPARLTYLHRHGLPGAPYARQLGDIGCFRPQEILTVQVAIEMVTTINALADGPATGRRFDGAVFTGDLTDNAQTNEHSWFAKVVAGGDVAAASGDPNESSWVGAPTVAWDDSYWHPESHRSGAADVWTGRFGFPFVDGLVGAARRRVWSPGLQLPVLAVHGNHDLLLEGSSVADAQARALATGTRRLTGLAESQTPLTVLAQVPQVGPGFYVIGDQPDEVVPADPARAIVDGTRFAGHVGLAAALGPTPGPGAAWTVAVTPEVRLVALDTVNPHGGWQGSIGADQLDWFAHVCATTAEPYLIVASHHPSWTLFNGYVTPTTVGDSAWPRRVLADELLATLLAQPRVIAWLAGHVHYHSVTVHRGAGNRVLPEITSASLIDWPQQARTFEVARNPDGTLTLISEPIDHGAPVAFMPADVEQPDQLAALSRTLSRNVPVFAAKFDPLEASGRRLNQRSVIVVPDPG